MQKCSVICSCFGSAFSCAQENARGFAIHAVDAQSIAREAFLHEHVERSRDRQRAIEPKVWRDVIFTVLGVRIPPFDQNHDRTEKGLPRFPHQTGVPDGKRRGKPPGTRNEGHDRTQHQKSQPGIVIRAGDHDSRPPRAYHRAEPLETGATGLRVLCRRQTRVRPSASLRRKPDFSRSLMSNCGLRLRRTLEWLNQLRALILGIVDARIHGMGNELGYAP